MSSSYVFRYVGTNQGSDGPRFSVQLDEYVPVPTVRPRGHQVQISSIQIPVFLINDAMVLTKTPGQRRDVRVFFF